LTGEYLVKTPRADITAFPPLLHAHHRHASKRGAEILNKRKKMQQQQEYTQMMIPYHQKAKSEGYSSMPQSS